VDSRLEIRPGISDRDRQTNSSHHREVSDVVSYICDLLVRISGLTLDFTIGIDFALNTLVNQFDSEFFGTVANDIRATAGDEANRYARANQQYDALAIAYVKPFGLDSTIVNNDTAVSKHAINIKQQKPDLFGFFSDAYRNGLHRKLNDTRFNEVVEMDHADGSVASVFDDEKRSNRILLHDMYRFSGKEVGNDRFRIPCH